MSKGDLEVSYLDICIQYLGEDGEIFKKDKLRIDKISCNMINESTDTSETAKESHFKYLWNNSTTNKNNLTILYNKNFINNVVDVVHVNEQYDINPNTNASSFSPSQTNSLLSSSTETYNDSSTKRIINVSVMVRCQNCDTNFPTKYQFQRHQCEFNAEKIVLKPNIDIKDVQRGVRMKFECNTCGKLFVSKNNLERHFTSHDEDNLNICEHCNKQFVSENRLRIHKENHCKKAGDISKFYRSDVKVYKCVKCFQVFSSDTYANNHAENCSETYNLNEVNSILVDDLFNLQKNDAAPGLNGSSFVEVVITETLLQCEFCNKTFADKKSLLIHQDTHTTAINYYCVFCTEKFDSHITAAKHWLTKCTNDANLFFLPKLTYCQECDRTFKSHEVLYGHKIKKKHYTVKKHELVKENNSVDQISVELDPSLNNKKQNGPQIINIIEGAIGSNFIKTSPKSSGDEIGREQSSSVSKSSENLLAENLTMSENDEAMSKFNESENDLLNGKKKRGRKKKNILPIDKVKRFTINVGQDSGYRYQCERCLFVFTNIQDMESHRDKDHPANYKCEECDQVVHSSKALIIHSRAHQRLKPYVCEICKRSYSQTSHLWQHMRFHQGIKPFACPHEGCEARYTIRPDLKDHIRKVHTRERPFKCTVCNKCFLTGSVYYQHRLIHTNDRRYACDVCHKRFFRADALNNHRRIHTDERPYPCEICGRNFRQKGDRNKHVRTQHPGSHV